MKNLFNSVLILLLTMFSALVLSQTNKPGSDKIVLNDGKILNCKVLTVTAENVEIDPEGSIPFEILKRSTVNTIIYSNGTVVNLVALSGNARKTEVEKNTDYKLMDEKGWPIPDIIDVISKAGIEVPMDGIQNEHEAEWEFFYYTEEGVKKIIKLSIAVQWAAWYAHYNLTKGALGASNFIAEIDVMEGDKYPYTIVDKKIYTLPGDLNFGTPFNNKGTTWYSEPFSYQNWRFSLILFIPMPRWSMALRKTDTAITYEYLLKMKVESK
jgi:hypothetical protein